MEPTLSILIVNWNTRALLLDCLRSLESATIDVPHEVIVVDNASADNSAAAVAAAHPSVRLIANPENVGFARANNQAYAESRGRYVLLLNSDTLVTAGQIEKLVAYLDAHDAVGIVGPKLLNADGSFQLSAVPFVTPWDMFYEYARFPRALQPRLQRAPRRLYAFEPWRAMSVDYVIGAVLLIRRSVIERIGVMDEHYFMYGEEQDWCCRAKAAGWEVHFLPEAEVTHLGGRSTAQVPYRMLAHRFVSSFRFVAIHQGPAQARLARRLLAAAALQNGLLALARFAARRDDWPTFRRDWKGNAVVLLTALTGGVPARAD